jgi:hypothetical protein
MLFTDIVGSTSRAGELGDQSDGTVTEPGSVGESSVTPVDQVGVDP